MNTKIHTLLIDDDRNVSALISSILTANNYQVIAAFSGKEGLSLAASFCPDIVLLDLNLPDINGYEIIKSIRSWSNIPIIVISAHNEEQEKVTAFDLGADDYITKPFGTAELVARVRTSLRHSHPVAQNHIYKAHDLQIDFEKRLILLAGKQVHLTQIEYQLLTLLAENSGQVVTYRYLMSNIWGPYIDNNNQILRVNMANIRRKIEKNPAQPEYVFTEIGIGYRMLEADAD
ncbi:MAG: response regulator transcription factor [Candidatus Gastranaerophilales bacterium]|nr:response regulator transcription factor [Candidatus Gastranaerophilales bacterium]